MYCALRHLIFHVGVVFVQKHSGTTTCFMLSNAGGCLNFQILLLALTIYNFIYSREIYKFNILFFHMSVTIYKTCKMQHKFYFVILYTNIKTISNKFTISKWKKLIPIYLVLHPHHIKLPTKMYFFYYYCIKMHNYNGSYHVYYIYIIKHQLKHDIFQILRKKL